MRAVVADSAGRGWLMDDLGRRSRLYYVVVDLVDVGVIVDVRVVVARPVAVAVAIGDVKATR
jgi:hypothetical protein